MKVLIVRVGAMGDVLHALPAVAALRQQRPDWQIDWVVDPRWAALLVDSEGRGPLVNAVHLARTRLWTGRPLSRETLASLRDLRRALRSQRYDLAVDMQGTLRSAVIGRMARPQALAGYSDPRESMAAWLYSRKIARRGTHVVDQGAELLSAACGVQLAPAVPDLPREPWAESWAEQEAVVQRPLCVLTPGGGWAAKHWAAARYGELAIQLRHSGFDVVVNAPRKDDAVALSVIAASRGAARLVVCNVSGLIALLRRTDLLVGGDTGPMHLAAMLAVPVVALFGPTSPARNGPWGPGEQRVLRDPASPTSYRHVATPDPGLANISFVQVLQAIKSLGL